MKLKERMKECSVSHWSVLLPALQCTSKLTGSFSCLIPFSRKAAVEGHASLKSTNEGQMALRRVQTAFKDSLELPPLVRFPFRVASRVPKLSLLG